MFVRKQGTDGDASMHRNRQDTIPNLSIQSCSFQHQQKTSTERTISSHVRKFSNFNNPTEVNRKDEKELCPSATKAFLAQARAEVHDTEAGSTVNRSKESDSLLFKTGRQMLLPGIHTAKGRHVVNNRAQQGF